MGLAIVYLGNHTKKLEIEGFHGLSRSMLAHWRVSVLPQVLWDQLNIVADRVGLFQKSRGEPETGTNMNRTVMKPNKTQRRNRSGKLWNRTVWRLWSVWCPEPKKNDRGYWVLNYVPEYCGRSNRTNDRNIRSNQNLSPQPTSINFGGRIYRFCPTWPAGFKDCQPTFFHLDKLIISYIEKQWFLVIMIFVGHLYAVVG